MSSRIQETFYLRTGELNLLLAGKGMRQIYMLQSEDIDMDEASVCLTLNQLYYNELIHRDEDELAIADELNELLTIICQADRVVFLRTGRMESAAMCLFMHADRMVSLVLSPIDKSAYRINEVDETILTEFFDDYCEMDGQYEPVLDEDAVFDRLSKGKDSVSNADIRGYRNVILLAEQLQAKNGRVAKRVILRYIPNTSELLVVEGGTTKLTLEAPMREQCVSQLVDMCRREETEL